jgi:hypothetical protein
VYVLVQFEYQVKSLEPLCFKLLLQVAEVGRLAASTKKVEIELKKAEGTGSIEEAKLVCSNAKLPIVVVALDTVGRVVPRSWFRWKSPSPNLQSFF